MRFLIDECCARAIAEALARAGHDVTTAQGVAPGATDRDLARIAESTGAIMVTEDYDFGELAVRWPSRSPAY